jgi:transcriptional regulator with XRE-family HTH domain
MGTKVRPYPRNLSQKLRQIRIDLALSQMEIVRRLGFGDSLHVGRISEYEQGLREPSLLVLLAYARLARVHLEDLVDDNIDLPARLPNSVFYRRSRRNDRLIGSLES